MRTAQNFLTTLGISAYTQRHINLINEFIDSKEKNIEILLNKLGSWDEDDLKKANQWNNL